MRAVRRAILRCTVGSTPQRQAQLTGTQSSHGYSPWLFLGLTIIWTWTIWGLAAAWGGQLPGALRLALYAAGGFGPALVASVLVGLGLADESLGTFWRRALDPTRLPARGWLALLALALLPPLLLRLATEGFEGGLLASAPLRFLLVGALAGVAEEPGWRGYAQHGLQRRMPVAAAALAVGVFWAAWHLPLFWMAGTWPFWMFHLAILVDTVLYAWLYNFAGRLTAAAVLLHAASNLANEAFAIEGASHLKVLVSLAVVVVVVVVWWRLMSRRTGC